MGNYFECMSAILAHYVTSKLVLEIGNLVAQLRQQGYKFHISWIKGHANHTGNEYVGISAIFAHYVTSKLVLEIGNLIA